MQYLIIITKQQEEFTGFWKHNENESQAIYRSDHHNILLLKKAHLISIENYSTVIIEKLRDKNITELGVIFHKINSDSDADKLKQNIEILFNSQIAFCKWYSSNKTDFWNANDVNADLPYNNLKKAWKDNNGDKEETFKAVWDYFLGDPEEERLTNEIFNAIYEQKDAEVIENAVNKRDKYIKAKAKN